jgi:prepilin-type N-terminal cleavage/methylation domain-containing protein
MVRRTPHCLGYTLIEMMITVAILGILVIGAPEITNQVIRFYQLHNAKIEIERDARACLDLINRYLRQGQAATVVIDQAAGQPPYSRISFKTIEGQTMEFYQQGTALYQVAISTSVISNNLHYIAFTYPRSDNPGIISVALTMEKSTYQGGFKALELSIQQVRIMD